MAVDCLFNSFLLDHSEGLFNAWFTCLLYGELRARLAERARCPVTRP